MKKLIFMVFFFLLCVNTYGAIHYLDPDGDNVNYPSCTIGDPCYDGTPISGNLGPGDEVLLHRGKRWEIITDIFLSVDSAGTEANPIIIGTYGEGADPVIDGSIPIANVTGFGGWSVHSGAIYKTDVDPNADGAAFTNAGTVWITDHNPVISTEEDDSLRYAGENGYVLARATSIANMKMRTFYFDSGAKILYAWLEDDVNPAGYAVRLAIYGSTFRGIIMSSSGGNTSQWIEFQNIKITGAYGDGFSSADPNNKFYRCEATHLGSEGFYIMANDAVSFGASNNIVQECVVDWAASNPGNGQGITVESANTIVRRCTITNSAMAGIDALDYNEETNVTGGKFIANNIFFNGNFRFSNSFDAGLYLDGASEHLVQGNVVYGEGQQSYAYPDAPVFSGVGLDDITVSGIYKGSDVTDIYIIISDTSPDKFKWKISAGGTYANETLITGSAQHIKNNVSITFGSTTGHTLDDPWFINNDSGGANEFTANFQYGIHVGTEHSTKPAENITVLNNLSYHNKGSAFALDSTNIANTISNIYVYQNSFLRGAGGFSTTTISEEIVGTVILKNNILKNLSNDSCLHVSNSTDMTNFVTLDNNLYTKGIGVDIITVQSVKYNLSEVQSTFSEETNGVLDINPLETNFYTKSGNSGVNAGAEDLSARHSVGQAVEDVWDNKNNMDIGYHHKYGVSRLIGVGE